MVILLRFVCLFFPCLFLTFSSTLILTQGHIQNTTNKCISTNSINSTSNSTSTSSMPTPILHHHLRLHRQPHRHLLPPQPLHHQGHIQHSRHMPHRIPMQHQERTTLREVMTPHRGATTLHPGATMPRLEATTPQRAMTHLEATGHREHMIHRELTEREATPPPHRMSRHPHTGNPCPRATITLTTRQNPLIDSPTPFPHAPYTWQMCDCVCARVCVCVCTWASIHKGQFKGEKRESGQGCDSPLFLHLDQLVSQWMITQLSGWLWASKVSGVVEMREAADTGVLLSIYSSC